MRLRSMLLLAAIGGMIATNGRADGPVRAAVRGTGRVVARTGEAAVNGTAAVVRGTGRVVARTGEATANAAVGAAQTTRNVVTAPIGGPIVQGRYSAGYRGGQYGAQAYAPAMAQGQVAGQAEMNGAASVDGHAQANGQWQAGAAASAQGQSLLTDRQGRQFICDHGHRVYVNTPQTNSQGQPTRAPAAGQPTYDASTPPAPPQANWTQGQSGQGEVRSPNAMSGLAADRSLADPNIGGAEAPREQRNEPDTMR